MGCGAQSKAEQKYTLVEVGAAKTADEVVEVVEAKPKLEPLPLIADNESRMVIGTVRPEKQYKLNPVFSEKLLNSMQELPPQASQMMSWRGFQWQLWEEADGLQLTCTSHGTSTNNKIVSWCGEPANSMGSQAIASLEVHGALPSNAKVAAGAVNGGDTVNYESGNDSHDAIIQLCHYDAEVSVEVINIPEETNKPPTELWPFMVKWDVNSRSKGFIIGCEDEMSCSKWVSHLKLYSNIRRRYCGTVVWKLGGSCFQKAKTLPDDWYLQDEHLNVYKDLQLWRRRIFHLEELQSLDALCMTYVSEKTDGEECIIGMLARVNAGKAEAYASVRRLPEVTLKQLTPVEAEKVSMSVCQYDIAVAKIPSKFGVVLPTALHGIELRQAEDTYGGQKHSILAFEDAETRDRLLESIEDASRQFSLRTRSAPLSLIIP